MPKRLIHVVTHLHRLPGVDSNSGERRHRGQQHPTVYDSKGHPIMTIKPIQKRGTPCNSPPNRNRFLLRVMILVVMTAAGITQPALAFQVSHDLSIALDPETGRLTGHDRMVATPRGAQILRFRLGPQVDVASLAVNGSPRNPVRHGDILTLPLASEEREGELRIDIRYSATFDDPAPRMPANTDNPGYGVTATIEPRGAFILGGAGWYPAVTGAEEVYRIRVSAPDGIFAVTSGRSLGTRSENGRSISEWEIRNPVESLALVASTFQIDTRRLGNITLATYFSPENAGLSSAYLEASARYITLYEDRFGPYPFEKFAVVENFFPTGYGFPSYTLIGGRILRLPFILDTSLGHEIAHCWWGNGVLVDPNYGNWSEGLTAYVAEHYYQEQESPQAARDHRLNYLRNYATLVSEADDFPLSGFRGRVDTITRTVGYDKGAMVFHMLRTRLGETAFWGGLRDVYATHRFQRASWYDFKKAFEIRSQTSLDAFFDSWVFREGAIELSLADVERSERDGRWRLSGAVRQKAPFYDPAVTVRIHDADGFRDHMLALSGDRTPFDFQFDRPPSAVEIDPHVDLFRRLAPEEIPPSINGLKGADDVVIVLGDGGADLRAAADMLIRAMPLRRATVISEADAAPDRLEDRHLIIMGAPLTPALEALVKGRIDIRGGAPALDGIPGSDAADTQFGVYHRPDRKERLMGVFLTEAPPHSVTVARKIPHYGRYSFLAFSGTTNRAKGIWPPQQSPLVHRWSGAGETTGRL